ncbi:dihydroneopterin aldolase [Lacibacterium aquatile]|uniref:7,8-dihydroneopterin aldolase n=1 Tax=Lacibacterium aquatile TaxID=1168082 RepID=A0ABW5DTV9_9PROT
MTSRSPIAAIHGADDMPSPRRGMHRMFIRDLVLMANIGAYAHEHGAAQRIRINVDLMVMDNQAFLTDRLEDVVSYDTLAQRIRAIVASGHVNLVETLAERIAAACLVDYRVRVARIRVEKLDIMPDTGGVGIEIERVASGA